MLLEARQLVLSYDGKYLAGPLNLSLEAGQRVWLIGPNGIGKSTLLRVIAGLAPAQGDLLGEAFPHHIYLCGSQGGLYESLRVYEQWHLSCVLAETSPQESKKWWDVFCLERLREQFISTLSAGQKQRLRLAQAFLFPALVYLWDEPLTSLDDDFGASFLDALNMKKNVAMVATSHQVLDGGWEVFDPWPCAGSTIKNSSLKSAP
jgi:ABC-type multidrug transport system ATPase subunit